MKKKLLMLANLALILTSANAQSTVINEGNTFEVGVANITNVGQTEKTGYATVSFDTGNYELVLSGTETVEIVGETREFPLTLISCSNKTNEKGEYISITSFTKSRDAIKTPNNDEIQMDDIIIEDEENEKYDIISLTSDSWAKYKNACQNAKNERIVPGTDLTGTDAEGYEINTNLYYYKSGKSLSKAKLYPICNIYINYYTEEVIKNCTDNYVPTEIGSSIENATINTDGQVVKVSGVVNANKIESIIAANNSKLNFDFTEATLFGDIINVTIAENKLAYFPSTGEGIVSKNTNIVVGSQCENYLITDGKEIYVNKPFTAGNATYNRTFTAGNYGTIVLPFAVPSTSGIFVKQARLASYDAENDIIKFSTAESIQPNVPYLFNAQAGGGSLEAINTPVSATPANSTISTDVTTLKFVGTFKEITGPTGFVISTAGNINKTKESTTIKAGRCYLTLGQTNAKLANTTIQIIDEDGSIEEIEVDSEVTAIDDIENGEVVATQYISINGLIANEPFSGMNIVKKTFANGTVETSKVVY